MKTVVAVGRAGPAFGNRGFCCFFDPYHAGDAGFDSVENGGLIRSSRKKERKGNQKND